MYCSFDIVGLSNEGRGEPTTLVPSFFYNWGLLMAILDLENVRFEHKNLDLI